VAEWVVGGNEGGEEGKGQGVKGSVEMREGGRGGGV